MLVAFIVLGTGCVCIGASAYLAHVRINRLRKKIAEMDRVLEAAYGTAHVALGRSNTLYVDRFGAA